MSLHLISVNQLFHFYTSTNVVTLFKNYFNLLIWACQYVLIVSMFSFTILEKALFQNDNGWEMFLCVCVFQSSLKSTAPSLCINIPSFLLGLSLTSMGFNSEEVVLLHFCVCGRSKYWLHVRRNSSAVNLSEAPENSSSLGSVSGSLKLQFSLCA